MSQIKICTRIRKKAQVFIELSFVLLCVIGALLAVHHYVKRAIQGRWREAADQIGEQYEPRKTRSNITTAIDREVITHVEDDVEVIIDDVPGYATRTTEQILEDVTRRSGNERLEEFGDDLWE